LSCLKTVEEQGLLARHQPIQIKAISSFECLVGVMFMAVADMVQAKR